MSDASLADAEKHLSAHPAVHMENFGPGFCMDISVTRHDSKVTTVKVRSFSGAMTAPADPDVKTAIHDLVDKVLQRNADFLFLGDKSQ